MADQAWEKLLERYADGRQICNCREAYYANDGTYWISGENPPIEHHDGLHCKYGCSANQIFCKHEIAKRVLAEITG